MFFCEGCRRKWRWPASISKSRGRCEMCNRFEYCFDIPASRLPDPIGVLTEEEKSRDDEDQDDQR